MGSLPNVSASAVGDRIARAEPQLLRCQLLAGPLIADIRLYWANIDTEAHADPPRIMGWPAPLEAIR
jgi:hypothetical protein